jgi:hypothetical protein
VETGKITCFNDFLGLSEFLGSSDLILSRGKIKVFLV